MALWAPSGVVSEDWGKLRVVVGGKNVTYFRGAETVVPGWSDQEPYGSGPAQVVFPQITELDSLGSGALSWLRTGADVDLYRVSPAGARDAAPLWSGYVKRLHMSNSVNEGALTAECSGAVQGSLGLILHQPRMNYDLKDIGRLMVRDMRHPAARIGTFEEIETGIDTRKRGSRSQYALDWIDELLAIAVTDDGDQWTLRRVATQRRVVKLQLKNRTTQNLTIHAGGRGVELDLSQDPTEQPNRIFGEGVGHDGNRWRNAVFPNLKPDTIPPYPGSPLDIGSTGDAVRVWQSEVNTNGSEVGTEFAYKSGVFTDVEADAARELQRRAGLSVTGVVNEATWDATWANGVNSANLGGARFDPIALDRRTQRWNYTGNGSLKEANPTFDRRVLPVEALVSYGEGISKRRASRAARAQLARYGSDPGWFGTITLSVDPVEMSRLNIRAGMNIRVKFFGGTAGILFHIAEASPSLQDPRLPVTLTVDSKARDLTTIAELMAADRESRQDPARNYLNQRRRSAHVRDTVIGWDKESGMGVVPDRDLQGGQWNVIKIPAAQYGSVLSTDLTVEPATRFYAAVFGTSVTRARLDSVNPNPGTARGDDYLPWDVPAIQDTLGRSNRTGMRLAMSWGNPGQAAGYWPGEQEKGHDPTGRLYDDASWSYISDDPPWLWLAVYPNADCTISGMLKAQVDE